MLSNHLYNLMEQIIEESKTCWRIENFYLKDSEGCGECHQFWKDLKADKERHIQDLKEIIKQHNEHEETTAMNPKLKRATMPAL